MFRWGVLSTAKIARTQVNPAISASENGVLHAIASRDLSKAQAMANQFGVPKAYGDYEALLSDPQVDGVYIPLHTSGHVEWSLKAAQAGKHVLCEKPIAMHADEIDQLIEIRDAENLVISEAFMVNYHPQWAKARALLEEGAIGELRHIQGAFSYFNADPGNMRNSPELGGGGLRDIGVYPLVTARIATGLEPTEICARIEFDPKFGTDIFADVSARLGQVSLSFYCATQMSLRQSMVFHGSSGAMSLSAPFNPPDYGIAEITLANVDRSEKRVWRFPGVNQYILQAEAFVRATQGKGSVFSLESSRANQAAIDACFTAGQSKGWVAVG